MRTFCPPIVALLLAGCPPAVVPGTTETGDTGNPDDTGIVDTGDTADTDVDTGDTADTDVDTGDTADTGDTGETDPPPCEWDDRIYEMSGNPNPWDTSASDPDTGGGPDDTADTGSEPPPPEAEIVIHMDGCVQPTSNLADAWTGAQAVSLRDPTSGTYWCSYRADVLRADVAPACEGCDFAFELEYQPTETTLTTSGCGWVADYAASYFRATRVLGVDVAAGQLYRGEGFSGWVEHGGDLDTSLELTPYTDDEWVLGIELINSPPP